MMNLLTFILFAGYICIHFFVTVECAFGDRIRPITPSPRLFRKFNATGTSTPAPYSDRVTVSRDLTPNSGSPEPADDEVPATPIDNVLSNDASYETDQTKASSADAAHDRLTDSTTPLTEDASSTITQIPDDQFNSHTDANDDSELNDDPLQIDSPQSINPSSDNISSSDTYSRFHYLPPGPIDSGFDGSHIRPPGNKIIVLKKIPRPVSYVGGHKKIIKIIDQPVYRDSNPRYRFIKKRIVHPHGLIPLNDRFVFGHKHFTHHRTLQPGYSGIPGTPWIDYPAYSAVPITSFSCKLTKYPGFYADVDAGCQAWHYCQIDGRQDKFLCPNGTLFNQATRVCDWWYNVDCSSSPWKYNVNADLYRVAKGYKKVLHLHPGKAPHVHRIPYKGRGVYKFSSGGHTSYPISLDRKIHKHHYLHHPHGKSNLIPRSFKPVISSKPILIPIKTVSHHHLHHHQSPGHRTPQPLSYHDLKSRFGHSIGHSHENHVKNIIRVRKIALGDPHHAYRPGGQSVSTLHGRSHHSLHGHKTDHHNHRDPLTGGIHHHHHHIGKTYKTSTSAALPPSLPLIDDHGRMPHHGHLILHHKLK